MMGKRRVVVYFLSLGSNIGNTSKNLAAAVRLLGENGVEVVRASSVYETEPVDHLDQPWFPRPSSNSRNRSRPG
jgi:7,8-dihydro-6-hydroxymethylpterin-pyrophosphokinase